MKVQLASALTFAGKFDLRTKEATDFLTSAAVFAMKPFLLLWLLLSMSLETSIAPPLATLKYHASLQANQSIKTRRASQVYTRVGALVSSNEKERTANLTGGDRASEDLYISQS